MTALPAIPAAHFALESASAKETAVRKEPGPLKDSPVAKAIDGRAGEAAPVKDPAKTDEAVSSFRRIFQEKKAEKETTDNKRNNQTEHPVKDQGAAKVLLARAAVKETVRKLVPTRENKKTTTLKELLDNLIDKNLKTKDASAKDKKQPLKTEKAEAAVQGERLLALQERILQSKKKDDAIESMKQVLAKAAADKPARQVVIVDLREKTAEKAVPFAASLKNAVKTVVEKTDTSENRKNQEVKDTYETKVFFKPGTVPERLDQTGRAAGGEAPAPHGDFSSRMADFMKHEVVRHTGLVLKDNGNGEIHLVLKPDSLGSVRIRVNVEDNHIVGKIIVDNNTVKRIMEENLGNLETALQRNGYQSAAFDVSVAGGREDHADKNGEFSGLLDGGRGEGVAPVKEYEAGGMSIYADSLVNIVL